MSKAMPTLAALALAVFLMPGAAGADPSDHRWITEERKYVRPKDGLHCCGSDHCKPRAPDFARETAEGWYVPSTGQLFKHGSVGLYVSERPEIWACMDGEAVGCLFVNPGGA